MNLVIGLSRWIQIYLFAFGSSYHKSILLIIKTHLFRKVAEKKILSSEMLKPKTPVVIIISSLASLALHSAQTRLLRHYSDFSSLCCCRCSMKTLLCFFLLLPKVESLCSALREHPPVLRSIGLLLLSSEGVSLRRSYCCRVSPVSVCSWENVLKLLLLLLHSLVFRSVTTMKNLNSLPTSSKIIYPPKCLSVCVCLHKQQLMKNGIR